MLFERPRRGSAALLALALLAQLPSATPDPASEPATDPWEPVFMAVVEREYPMSTTGSTAGSTTGRRQATPGAWSEPKPRGLQWRKGQMVLQGWLGFTDYTSVTRTGGVSPPVEGQGIENMPVIGGGAQWKMNQGHKLDLGLEALINFSGRANGGAVWFGGGGGGVAVNIDMWVFELLGGAVISKFVSEKVRVYASGGPLMQWVNYAQSGPLYQAGSGFGTGWYGRFGFEWAASGHTLVGLGARYSETKVGLGNGLGDLDIEGWQYLFTVTTGF